MDKQHSSGQPEISPNTKKIVTLQEHVVVASKFINAQNVSRVSIMVSGKHYGKDFNEIIVWGNQSPVDIPVKELKDLFQAIADRFHSEVMNLFFPRGEPVQVDRNGKAAKSPCCNAKMFAVNKPNPQIPGRTTIDYIYCSDCDRKLDGNGEILIPEAYHTPLNKQT